MTYSFTIIYEPAKRNNINLIDMSAEDFEQGDKYFMDIATLARKYGKDPKFKVGACIVNENRKVIGIGQNTMPRGGEGKLPWTKNKAYRLDDKRTYVCHAELNAIVNANGNVRNCTMYVTLYPCNECAKLIIQSGIKEVVYLSDEKAHQLGMQASRQMFELAGIPSRLYGGQ